MYTGVESAALPKNQKIPLDKDYVGTMVQNDQELFPGIF